jgi:hypothetical protein
MTIDRALWDGCFSARSVPPGRAQCVEDLAVVAGDVVVEDHWDEDNQQHGMH